MDSASVAAIATSSGLAVGAALTWLTTRRASSGRVGTSEASVVWQQSQQIRTELVAQRDRAEAQRDRLIESQATQVVPALAGINDALRIIGEALARVEAAGRGGGQGGR